MSHELYLISLDTRIQINVFFTDPVPPIKFNLFIPLPRFEVKPEAPLSPYIYVDLLASALAIVSQGTYTDAPGEFFSLRNPGYNIKVLKAPAWSGVIGDGPSPQQGTAINYYPYGQVGAANAYKHTTDRQFIIYFEPLNIYEHQIPAGYYNKTQFASYIDALVKADDANLTFSVNADTGHCTFEHATTSLTIYGTGLSKHVMGFDSANGIFDHLYDRKLLDDNIRLLPAGFDDFLYDGNLLHKSSTIIDLRGVEMVFIHCSFIDGQRWMTDKRINTDNKLKGDILDSIPINKPFGDTVFHKDPSETLAYDFFGGQNISQFRVSLTDQRGKPITPNLNWSMMLVVYIEN